MFERRVAFRIEHSTLGLNGEENFMISLAQRVRDFRYSKGWGPDELAIRAEISRTALYQIESGKTGLPRAGTLRRIAVALDVSMDDLLGNTEPASGPVMRSAGDHTPSPARKREISDWIPSEGGPLALPSGTQLGSHSPYAGLEQDRPEEARFAVESQRRAAAPTYETLLMREGELMSKLHDLLHSPLGTGIARILDELHTMIPRNRNLS
jgi:transcriptional regulator with XRE-family HTH domain